ncbi:hypothetical protein [Kitasatospora cinereorecta]|uniref:Uncharacterized protein n=1 Tax=Kitasatospora cinereorecta TaxID=285560 RepID=A0ABW0VME5_9ACTN
MDLTEQLPVATPLVAGLLRLPATARARLTALSGVLAEFCERRELRLTKVLMEDPRVAPDRAIPDLIATRPVLYGIVLPSLAHLGTAELARERQQQLADVGTRLLLVRGAGAGSRADAPGRRIGRLTR